MAHWQKCSNYGIPLASGNAAGSRRQPATKNEGKLWLATGSAAQQWVPCRLEFGVSILYLFRYLAHFMNECSINWRSGQYIFVLNLCKVLYKYVALRPRYWRPKSKFMLKNFIRDFLHVHFWRKMPPLTIFREKAVGYISTILFSCQYACCLLQNRPRVCQNSICVMT